MSFLLFINFLFLISPWPYFMCIYLHYRTYINSGTSRSNSPQSSRLLIFQNILSRLESFENSYSSSILGLSVYSFSFSAIDRVWLNLYERALSGNEQLPFIKLKTFVREFIQCRTFPRVLYLVRNARSACYT